MKTYFLILFSIAIYTYCMAGEVTGVVKVASTNVLVDNGNVTIFNAGYKRTTQILPSGDYSFSGLSSGTYTIAAISEGLIDTIINVIVNNEGITNVDLYIKTTTNYIQEIVVNGGNTGYNNKLINRFEVHPEMITTQSEIKNMGHIEVKDIVAVKSGVYVNEDNEISIRGSRPTATRIMVDGVYSNITVPTTAIKYVQVYSGGVPAKYGDTSGGVIVIETKGFYDNY